MGTWFGGASTPFAICTVLHLSRQHIQFVLLPPFSYFSVLLLCRRLHSLSTPHALFWSPHKGGLGKLPLAHMLGELFSRMAAGQGLRRGVHRAGEGVSFITLLLARSLVEAVDVVHGLFVAGRSVGDEG